MDSFHTDSTFFYPGKECMLKDNCYNLELTEDLAIDLSENSKNLKVTLIGVNGRPLGNKFSILNELRFEEELGTFILKTETL